MSQPETVKKSRRRQLSWFLCREMLYDYVAGALDKERHTLVSEFIANHKEAREELACVQYGIFYCDALAKTAVSEPLMEKISGARDLSEQIYHKVSWKRWPSSLRIGLEALFVSAAVAAATIFLPWHEVSHWAKGAKSLIVGKSSTVRNSDERPTADVAKVVKVQPGPLHGPPTPKLVADAPAVETPAALVEVAQTKPTTSTEPPPARVVASPSVGTDAPMIAAAPAPVESKKAVPAVGYVYRAFISLEDVDTATTSLVNKIAELGGEKAGTVRLGWRKPESSYFHFSLPEERYEDLLKAINAFAPVSVSKDRHSRIMPEGRVRMILTILDNRVKHNRDVATENIEDPPAPSQAVPHAPDEPPQE